MVNRLSDSSLKAYEQQLRLNLQETEQQLLSLQAGGAVAQTEAAEESHWMKNMTMPVSVEAKGLIDRYNRLDASLCQIELGLFGVCSDCEAPIEVGRLEKDPTIQRCARCERLHAKRFSHSRDWL